ncbi:MAG: glycosyltransferase family 39 protein [Planctomycetia bacterium]|nr:glycosyltransferase family 39 protein [Planctomycetia bacterium]
MSTRVAQRWSVPLLLTWCAFLFFYGVNGSELYRTESLRAIIGAECLRDGHWLVPTLYGQPLLTKPPGMYVAIAACSWPFGEVTQWSARLPSALGATATVFLFYWYFGRILGRAGGLLAAICLPMSLFWLDKAPSAEIDMLQVAWIAGAVLFGLRAVEAAEDAEGTPSWPWFLAALGCVAGGFLTKWTAPLFFYATLLPLLYWRGRLRLLWGVPHLAGVVLATSLCLGWAAWAASLTGWEEFRDTVWREAVQHLSPVHHQATVRQLGEHHHDKLDYWGHALAFPPKILGMSLPWSFFALLALRPSFYRSLSGKRQFLLQALHCWTWPNLLIWTFLPDPSPRHAAPLLPGITGLAALWLVCRFQTELVVARKCWAGMAFTSLLIAWIVAKVIFVQVVMPARMAERAPCAKGGQIAAQVPGGQLLYLCRVKDEGIMFYYGRPVRRLETPDLLPSPGEPMYCMLTGDEWRDWTRRRPAELLLELHDQQGDPIALVRVSADR